MLERKPWEYQRKLTIIYVLVAGTAVNTLQILYLLSLVRPRWGTLENDTNNKKLMVKIGGKPEKGTIKNIIDWFPQIINNNFLLTFLSDLWKRYQKIA